MNEQNTLSHLLIRNRKTILDRWLQSTAVVDTCRIKNMSCETFDRLFASPIFDYICLQISKKGTKKLLAQIIGEIHHYKIFVVNIYTVYLDLRYIIEDMYADISLSSLRSIDKTVTELIRITSKDIAISAVENSWWNYIKLLDNMTGLLRIDPCGIITKANKEFLQLSWYDSCNIVWVNYIPPLQSITDTWFICEPRIPILTDKKIVTIWETIQWKNTWKWLIKHKAKTWAFFWGSVVILPIVDARKKITEFIVSVTDVTHLETAKIQLRRSIRHLKELDIKKDEFLNIASHELRTPMTSIRGYTSMILDWDTGEVRDETKVYLEHILESSTRLIALINDMLNIAKLESGKDEFQLEIREISECIISAIADIKPLMLQKKQHLHVEIEFNELFYKIDPNKFKQVLLNLIGNAIKFTPEGWNISIRSYIQDTGFCIHIKDDGIGIKKEEQEIIFEKFWQAKHSLTRQSGGTGLWLPIAKEIVEKMWGEITLTSEEGSWTDFCIYLPFGRQRKLQYIIK